MPLWIPKLRPDLVDSLVVIVQRRVDLASLHPLGLELNDVLQPIVLVVEVTSRLNGQVYGGKRHELLGILHLQGLNVLHLLVELEVLLSIPLLRFFTFEFVEVYFFFVEGLLPIHPLRNTMQS